MPTSPWPRDGRLKKIGYYMGTTMLGTLSPYKRMLALAGLDASEIDDLVGEVSRELHDVRRHWYMSAYVHIYTPLKFAISQVSPLLTLATTDISFGRRSLWMLQSLYSSQLARRAQIDPHYASEEHGRISSRLQLNISVIFDGEEDIPLS